MTMMSRPAAGPSDFAARVKAQKTVWAAGAYDALSARLIQEAGFDAVMTSGFGVSASVLGVPDAELYTMTENLAVARNVVSAIDVPLVADIDTGYGNAINVMRTMREFEAAGVSAVILEDQLAPKRCPICVGGVEVIAIEEAEAKISAAAATRHNPDILIIARTDVTDPDEAIARGKAYVAAGADIIQPISKCFSSVDGLRAMRQGCGVPLSLQMLGWLENDLSPAEVSEVAGLATFALVPIMTATQALRENLAALAQTKRANSLPRPVVPHSEFIDFIGFPQIEELQMKYLNTD